MIAETTQPSDVFDPDAVSSLTGHPDDRAFGFVFVSRYRGLLPQRVRRIAASLSGGDVDDATDAVLSLKVASITVGAHELAEISTHLERSLRRGDHLRVVDVEVTLAAAVERVDHALGAFLQA